MFINRQRKGCKSRAHRFGIRRTRRTARNQISQNLELLPFEEFL
jgi:hypothetical protein